MAYLHVISEEGACHTGFVLGKAKLAPQAAHTIPRLELGAAVLTAELAETIMDELDFSLDAVEFYTDSRVVLGYINNQTRRFYVYVANRVQRIRKVSSPTQWHYISTKHNPADRVTRSVPADLLSTTTWLTGPAFLLQAKQSVLQTVQKNNRQFTYGQTVQKKQQTIYIWTDSAKKLHWSIYSAPDSAKTKKQQFTYGQTVQKKQ